MVIIKRSVELERFRNAGPWIYVCGRRKTGKTFFIKNFTQWDEYFFVRKDGAIFDKNARELSFATFFEVFKEMIGRKKIVVDEFHRLPDKFFDYLHFLGAKGNLVVVSSTLWLSKKLLGHGSPLLGLFDLIVFGIVDERDIILSLRDMLKGRELIETCVYLREPVLASGYKKPLREFISRYLYRNYMVVREMIGEIFDEEERMLSNVYEGIMRAVSDGKNISTEISTYLFSKGLIKKDNPGYIQRYLDNLVKMGILERMEIWGKKKFRYFHASPLFDLHYYLDEKYAYTENELEREFIKRVVDTKIPYHVEQFFRNLLSKIFGLKKVIVEEPEIDIALVDFKKIKVVAEVKWKNKISRAEIKRVEENLNKFNCRKILIVPKKDALEREPEGIEVWDVDKILEIV